MAAVKKKWIPKLSRDLTLFVGGLVGIFHEAFIHTGAERPYLLVVFSGMAGLPVFLGLDEHRNSSPEEESEPKPKHKPSLTDLTDLLEKLEQGDK